MAESLCIRMQLRVGFPESQRLRKLILGQSTFGVPLIEYRGPLSQIMILDKLVVTAQILFLSVSFT